MRNVEHRVSRVALDVANGALLDSWPSNVDSLMFHPSRRLSLDGGQLDLGIIRDETRVGTTDVIMFSEVMEHAASHGIERLRLSMQLAVNGTSSGRIDIYSAHYR
jgi:hypothetical protein